MAGEPEVDRTAYLERAVRVLDNALDRMAQRGCEYADVGNTHRPKPCDCPPCEAKATRAFLKDWRFIGAHARRLTDGHHPREVRMHTAWKNAVDDRTLGMLLSDAPLDSMGRPETIEAPSARDWFVATTVVQWLATNVGMAVLEGAGFKYQHWDEDRKAHEAKMKERGW